MSYLHNGSTLEHSSNWFGKIKWRPTTKVFFYFWKLVMWPTFQQPAWTLTHRIIMILYFLTSWSYISFRFSGYNVLVTIFGNVHRPCRHYFIIVNNSLYHASSFFPHFLALFTSVNILGNAHRLCKQCINIIKKSLNHVYSFSRK